MAVTNSVVVAGGGRHEPGIPRDGMGTVHSWCAWAGCSQMVLALQAPAVYAWLPSWAQSVVTNLFLLQPGMALVRAIGPTLSAPGCVLIVLWGMLGMVVLVVGMRALMVAGGIIAMPFDAWGFWLGCAFVVDALWVGALMKRNRAKWHTLLPPVPGGVIVVAIGAYLLASWGSTAVVPPQQDQDMVVICPVDGLFTHLAPYGLETRYPYQFNKPLALYFLTGASVILRGELDAARPFCSSARGALALMNEDSKVRKERLDELRNRDIQRFYRLPQLTASVRIPARGIAALLAVTLFLFIARFGASGWAAFLSTATVLTLPEMFIRCSYAGFTAISLVELLVIAWLYLSPHQRYRGRMLFAGSLLLALTNHKPLFVVPVFMVADLVACPHGEPFAVVLMSWGRRVWRTGIAGGALLGTVLFWLYGAVIDWKIFRDDHVCRDILFRFTHGPDASYPSLIELWLQWLRNTSLLFLPLAAACLVYLVRKRPDLGRPLALWFVLGATLASAVDWKQTKHLMLSFPPLALAPGLAVSVVPPAIRRVIAGLLILTTAINAYTLYQIAHDFAWLTPSKVW